MKFSLRKALKKSSFKSLGIFPKLVDPSPLEVYFSIPVSGGVGLFHTLRIQKKPKLLKNIAKNAVAIFFDILKKNMSYVL